MSEIINLPPSRGITAATAELRALLRSMPSLGEAWKPSDPLPASYRRLIDQAIPLAERVLLPASDEAMAVAIGKLLEWVELFGVVPLPTDPRQRREKQRQTGIWYREGLAEVPGDLLVLAVERTIIAHKYSTLPKVAEIRQHVSAEWGARRIELGRLQLAAKIGRFDPPPMQAGDRIAAGAVRALAQALQAPPLYAVSTTLPALPATPATQPARRGAILSCEALVEARAAAGMPKMQKRDDAE